MLKSGGLDNASEEDIMKYIEENQLDLEDQPTELLMQIAEKLKERRN